MAAVPEGLARDAHALALVDLAETGRVLAWHGSRAVGVDEFMADVAGVAAALPTARAAINLCEDRYGFLVAFCAVISRGQTNLLPPSRAPQAVDEALAAYPGAYTLGETAPAPTPRGFVRIGPCGTRDACIGRPTITADHIAAIGFTSGSTGLPKPNPKTWASFRASTAQNVAALRATLGMAAGHSAHIVATVPPQHMYGIELSILLPLLGPFAVHSGRPLFPADVAAALAEVPEPRVLVTTPVHLRALLRDPVPLPKLAAITSA
ncbi:MAG: AMP-binding protein, partial [Lysobacterales bacterium]